MRLICYLFLSLLLFSFNSYGQWTLQNSGTINTFFTVDFVNGNEGWIAGPNDVVKHTTDGGMNWSTYNGQLFPSYRDWFDIEFVNEDEGYICGTYDLDWYEAWWTYTKNGGSTWIRPGSGTYVPNTSAWSDVFFLNQELGWRVGYRNSVGKISITSSGVSDEWQTISVPDPLHSVFFIDEKMGWSVGSNGAIYFSSDGGESWIAQVSGTTKTLKSVFFTDPLNGCIVGHKNDEAIILKTNDGGENWISFFPSEIVALHSVIFIDKDHGWACGSKSASPKNKGVILFTEDGGKNWTVNHEEDNCSILYDIDFKDDLGYAVGTSGTVLKLVNSEEFLDFTSLSNMLHKKYGIGYTSDENNIYIVGGERPSPLSKPWISKSIEKYNVSTNKWTQIFSDLIPRRYCSAEYIPQQNKIYIFNGDTYSNTSYTDTIEIYDLSTGKVSYSVSNPYPVEYAGSAVWNNKIYVFGGSNSDGFSKRLYEFDTDSHEWTRLADMPQPKQTNGEIVDGVLYVFGGYNFFTSNRIDAYDISSDTWSYLGDLPAGISAHATSFAGESIWLVGSYDNTSFIGKYDIKTEKIKQFYSNMEGRRHAGSSIIKDNLYVFGGNQVSDDEIIILNSLQSANINDFIDPIDRGFQNSKLNIIFHPNPGSGLIKARYELTEPQSINLKIFNFQGILVDEIKDYQYEGPQQLIWDTKSLVSGIYFYSLKIGDNIKNGKIIVVEK